MATITVHKGNGRVGFAVPQEFRNAGKIRGFLNDNAATLTPDQRADLQRALASTGQPAIEGDVAWFTTDQDQSRADALKDQQLHEQPPKISGDAQPGQIAPGATPPVTEAQNTRRR